MICNISILDQPAEKVPKELFCLAAAKLASQKAQWERTPQSWWNDADECENQFEWDSLSHGYARSLPRMCGKLKVVKRTAYYKIYIYVCFKWLATYKPTIQNLNPKLMGSRWFQWWNQDTKYLSSAWNIPGPDAKVGAILALKDLSVSIKLCLSM